MGLNASSDEWCRQSDIIIAGLPYAMKIVDDTIIWASSEAELEERVTTVLQRCADNNITVTFADSYLRANIEFRNKACTRGKYYSYTKLYFVLFVFIYVLSLIHI